MRNNGSYATAWLTGKYYGIGISNGINQESLLVQKMKKRLALLNRKIFSAL